MTQIKFEKKYLQNLEKIGFEESEEKPLISWNLISPDRFDWSNYHQRTNHPPNSPNPITNRKTIDSHLIKHDTVVCMPLYHTHAKAHNICKIYTSCVCRTTANPSLQLHPWLDAIKGIVFVMFGRQTLCGLCVCLCQTVTILFLLSFTVKKKQKIENSSWSYSGVQIKKSKNRFFFCCSLIDSGD